MRSWYAAAPACAQLSGPATFWPSWPGYEENTRHQHQATPLLALRRPLFTTGQTHFSSSDHDHKSPPSFLYLVSYTTYTTHIPHRRTTHPTSSPTSVCHRPIVITLAPRPYLIDLGRFVSLLHTPSIILSI